MTNKHMIAMIDINNDTSISLFESIGAERVYEDDVFVRYDLK